MWYISVRHTENTLSTVVIAAFCCHSPFALGSFDAYLIPVVTMEIQIYKCFGQPHCERQMHGRDPGWHYLKHVEMLHQLPAPRKKFIAFLFLLWRSYPHLQETNKQTQNTSQLQNMCKHTITHCLQWKAIKLSSSILKSKICEKHIIFISNAAPTNTLSVWRQQKFKSNTLFVGF